MIDGIKFTCAGLHPSVWIQNTLLDFGGRVSYKTGQSDLRQTANFQSMEFVVSENGSCSLHGSLHKYYNANDTNYNAFSFNNLTETLNNLNLNFSINPHNAEIHSIEIGVNINLDFKPKDVLNSLICHKNKPFNLICKNDKLLGKVCTYTDYEIKIYDTARKHKIKENILRFELKIKRQRLLEPYGISTLSDLQNVEKVVHLLRLLLDRINEIVFFDFHFPVPNLSQGKANEWEQYSNPNFWAQTSAELYDKRKAHYDRKQYKALMKKYKCFDWNLFMQQKVSEAWYKLFGKSAEKVVYLKQAYSEKQAQKYTTFSDFKYIVEKVESEFKNNSKKTRASEKKFCVSCGRDISHQKGNSRFCSERLYGKAAKRCRNKTATND